MRVSTAKRWEATARWLLLLIFCGPLATSGVAAEVVTIEGVGFRVADGWTLERVAAEPLVRYPICGDFAPDGRLFVVESSGSSAPVKQQLEDRSHRLITLEDRDGDGHFDQRTVFAEGLSLPQGVLCWRDRVLVAAPPQIWEFRDTDGDGVSDERSVWFDGKTLTGCANDLHGPYRGRDGAVYWCKGAFAEQQYPRSDGTLWTTRASHVLRRHPRTGSIESVMTGGMDNPVEFATTLCGERFFTCTFIQQPAEGLRDGLVHAVYGGLYGKVNGVLAGHPRTGPLMPVLAHLGPAAPAGLMLREATLGGDDLLGELLVAQFNLQKVSRHRLIPEGSAFRTEDSDLLVADRPDFHPTDVLEDADGSLLVIDTGGWYTLCCPTSHIDQSRATGGIYRLRQDHFSTPADPRGAQLDWDSLATDALVAQLGDPRPAVRGRSRQRLVASAADDVVRSLSHCLQASESRGSGTSALHRAEAVWCLVERIGASENANEVEQGLRQLVEALADPVLTVQLAAAQGVSLYRFEPAAETLHHWLIEGTPRHARAAAEALGRIGSVKSVPPLLAAFSAGYVDRELEHALRYAILEIGSAATPMLTAALAGEAPGRRLTAMQVLDQLDSPALEAQHVVAALRSDIPEERELAAEILSQRAEWDAMLAKELPELLRQGLAAEDRPSWQVTVQRLVTRPGMSDVVGRLIASGPQELREEILSALQLAPPTTLPAAWIEPLVERLTAESSAPEELSQLASLLSAIRWQEAPPARLVEGLRSALQRWSGNRGVWLMLAAAVPPGMELPEVAAEKGTAEQAAQPQAISGAILRLIESLAADRTPRDRALALAALQRQTISKAIATRLAAVVDALGPMELRGVLGLLRKQHAPKINAALLVSLAANPAIESLPSSLVEDHFAEHPAAVKTQAMELIERFSGDRRAEQAEHLARLLAELPAGDPLRGFQVFRSQQAACSACHSIGYHGGRIGPDLTRIHSIRTEQDLLEAIVYPSVSFVRSYESLQVLTADGRVYNGLLASEDLESVTLVMGIDQRIRIPREEIETIQPSSVSIMPAGLDQQLTPQQLADLVALLKSER